MRFSKYFIPTYREIPSEAEVISHQLMLRAGMIRKLTSGIYTYMPVGLRSLRKLEAIIRQEMNRAGAIEVLMPAVQPCELWQESARWDVYGRELLRFRDRHNHDYCFGPTHEEVITDLVRREIHSYRQMPLNLYQIQTKFRDEIRPRFGLMRGREFIMKDAYSFDISEEATNASYEQMRAAYDRIFQRCGLKFTAVEADSGPIGGSFSHEFMVLADTGEDAIIRCPTCGYAANLERAEIACPAAPEPAVEAQLRPVEPVETPDIRTVEEVTRFLGITAADLIKSLIFVADEKVVAVLVRGDHEINETKLKNFLNAQEVELADPGLVAETTGAPMGFAGPLGLKVRIVADNAVARMANFVTGGNRKDLHLKNVNLERDFRVAAYADLRVITPADACPRCGGELWFGKGIEVGHIFKLGTKYSRALKALFLDEEGQEQPIIMGCYGIGLGRTIAAAIEQNHDEKGIIFPVPLAPFEVAVLPLQIHEAPIAEAAESIYRALLDQGVDVLLDDRDERAGVKFNDADLLGIPVRVTIGSKALGKGQVEVKYRDQAASELIPLGEAPQRIRGMVQALYDSIQ